MANGSCTIFIVVARGFIVRNILRSGVLERLTQTGHRVVIFFPQEKGYEGKKLREEFTRPSVMVEFLPDASGLGRLRRGLYHFFKKMTPNLVYTQSTWTYSRIGNKRIMNRSTVWAYIERMIYRPLSAFHSLKTLARFLYLYLFYSPVYASYFEKYAPDLIFSTSIISKQDVQFMKEAKRRGVRTVSMPKGWDNISKMLYAILPDTLIVQNEIMRRDAIQYQRMPASHIAVCGFPQFDWYRRPEILMARETLMNTLGLSPDRRLIFFGSEGMWAPLDHVTAGTLAKFVNDPAALAYPCALLVRPHFSDIHDRRFESLRGIPNVVVDDNITLSNYFNDNWNPSAEETRLFVNCLYHSDLLVTSVSTLVLDGASVDKPLIAIAYGIIVKGGRDVSTELYETDHFKAVLRTRAVDVVRSDDELRAAVNRALEHPDYKKAERERLIADLCFRVDGRSSERVVKVLLANLPAKEERSPF
jgi:hypothetical protein